MEYLVIVNSRFSHDETFYVLCEEESASTWSRGQAIMFKDLIKVEKTRKKLEEFPGSVETYMRLEKGM